MRADVQLSDAMIDQSLDELQQRWFGARLREAQAWRPTPVCDVSVLKHEGGEHTRIFLKHARDDRLAGVVALHHVRLRAGAGIVTLSVPHSRLRRAVRGLGLARWVYGSALRDGARLLSSARQSAGAVRLWESLGRDHPRLDVWVEGRNVTLLSALQARSGQGTMEARWLLHPATCDLRALLGGNEGTGHEVVDPTRWKKPARC
jgi:hypothetical protein